jgi:hypothetical protein
MIREVADLRKKKFNKDGKMVKNGVVKIGKM